ncbi:MAG: type II toxin-antitoxin system VapC family toxin [Deltaproteobacteria bacterium]|nr:type II toxin-antitoxin system VapC family toxin [Deltaproteobacteria bacterium]
MQQMVIDCSVAVKWFDQDEERGGRALRLLELFLKGEIEFIIPDLLFYEAGNVFWKKWKGHPEKAEQSLIRLWELPWLLMPLRSSLLTRTAEIANRFQTTYYDSLYLAVAERTEASFVTADKKLLSKIKTLPFAKHLEEIPGIS